ncbi:MAG: hypothetical protein IAG13_03665 [Deltaproteobacteria bacterium]|nr:hypothetical protein [Nannocystaceae bacterium]
MTERTPGEAALLDELLQSACIFSGGRLDFPAKWRRAERIRVHHPELATASIHAAVVCGELEQVERMLADDPALVGARGGPQSWEPLLFACYGRLPNRRFDEHSVAIVRALLDAGADAGTSFIHPDGEVRFFALTGVIGHGELAQPEHPRADELARLLLARGADPNDSQALYDTHLVGDDPKWLELLLAHGLGPRDRINWHADPDEVAKAGPILDYLVAQAATNGHERRLRCLLAHGADANARSSYTDHSGYQAALIAGRRDLAELLVAHGAEPLPVEGVDAFVAACNANDRELAERMLAEQPDYLDHVDALVDAVMHRNRDAVMLLLELGMDPNRPGRHCHVALHAACEDRELVEALLAHGADPRARCFGGSAAGWARHAGNLAMARILAERSHELLDAVLAGHLALVATLLLEDPGVVHSRGPDGSTAMHVLPDDPAVARPIVDALLAHGIDLDAVDHEGLDAIARLEHDGLDELAAVIERARSR